MKQRGPLMGLELTTDRYPPITSQTRYPLRHAASKFIFIYVDAITCLTAHINHVLLTRVSFVFIQNEYLQEVVQLKPEQQNSLYHDVNELPLFSHSWSTMDTVKPDQ